MKGLFGTDGIRGRVGIEITEELAFKLGSGLTELLRGQGINSPRLLIGTDTRESAGTITAAVEEGIASHGGMVISCGVCPTPAIAYLTLAYSCDAGIVISASHNSFEYNGIKLFGPDGFKLADESEAAIEEHIFNNKEKAYKKSAPSEPIADAINVYIDYLKGCFSTDLKGLKIAIDCANGATARTAKRLFSDMGCECLMIGNNPNGVNINLNCGSTNTGMLREIVAKEGLDLGIAFDGDGDRCIAIDENGNEVDGDHIMAILALDMKKRGMLKNDTAVGTVMTNFGFEMFCRENGINFLRTKVGDKYVLDEINRGDFSLGGEQSGHIILRDFATTGDGQLTALALMSVLKKSKKKLSELASVMKKYPQFTCNLRADSTVKAKFNESFEVSEILSDYYKKMGNRGRIIVRPSGTEPMIRIMTEGENEEQTKRLCEEIRDKLQELLFD